MAKKTKESKPFTIRMEKSIYNRLEKFCDAAGQTKTLAVERAINNYINNYEEERRKIRKYKGDIIKNVEGL